MKKLLLILQVVGYNYALFGQNEMANNVQFSLLSSTASQGTELKNSFLNQNFSSILKQTNNNSVIGYIGSNFERFQIKFTTIKKYPYPYASSLVYTVQGQTKTKKGIAAFYGKITIANIMALQTDDTNIKNQLKYQIVGNYKLKEYRNHKYIGVYEGQFSSLFATSSDSLHYIENIKSEDNTYSNNQFEGTYKSYYNIAVMPCNWGNQRIPNSNNLDVGLTEFVPAPQYLKNGWQTYFDAYINNKPLALKEENKKWWWQ